MKIQGEGQLQWQYPRLPENDYLRQVVIISGVPQIQCRVMQLAACVAFTYTDKCRTEGHKLWHADGSMRIWDLPQCHGALHML